MVSEPFGPQVVRKYWLLAELGRALAMVPMAEVEFADGDIHRQVVRYENGATVWVNRSNNDWRVGKHVLAPFSFYAQVPLKNSSLETAIERLPTTDGDSVIAEWMRSERFVYCNARSMDLFGRLQIRLQSAEVKWLGNRQFELTLKWQADKPTELPCIVFVHFTHPRSERGEQIAFQGDHTPSTPTTQWQGEVVTRTVVTVPEPWGADRYGVRLGLRHQPSRRRFPLMGESDDTRRLIAGDLVLEGKGNELVGVRFVAVKQDSPLRWNPEGKSVDFGFAVTEGAFRFDRKTLTLLPLPDHPPFTVTLRLQKLLGATKRIAAVEAIDESGKVIGTVPFTQRNGEVTFRTQASVFAYRLRLKM